MRRVTSIVVGALALLALAGGGAGALESTTTTLAPTTTTSSTTTPPTTAAPTTTTAKPTSTTNTTSASTGAKPPPASGASQPLDPSLLGGAPIPTVPVNTTTSLISVPPLVIHTPTTVGSNAATAIVHGKDGAPGSTMVLATVAWLASLGGLLVYMEDKRGQKWRHLAR